MCEFVFPMFARSLPIFSPVHPFLLKLGSQNPNSGCFIYTFQGDPSPDRSFGSWSTLGWVGEGWEVAVGTGLCSLLLSLENTQFFNRAISRFSSNGFYLPFCL